MGGKFWLQISTPDVMRVGIMVNLRNLVQSESDISCLCLIFPE